MIQRKIEYISINDSNKVKQYNDTIQSVSQLIDESKNSSNHILI